MLNTSGDMSYGACELINAQAFFLVAPNRLACDFSDFSWNTWFKPTLKRFHVVIWDQAGFSP